ncbi:N-acetylmuramoyl-L-alanine amidase [Rosenbergiella australiborealis]|uniref:N-acetylmuramoyl-L-alanine amidase n=1 Tax=Rosenbergiella australiborealis TaxID=1544696 RepID=UPI001F4D4106|nr:N-acetylmuramoyl-L-alanine amidase [Rosenbergiella australiborealis]
MQFQIRTLYCRQWRCRLTAIAWLMTFLSNAHATADVQFIAARVWPSTLYTRLTLESEAAPTYRYFLLHHPERLVIDVDGGELTPALRQLSRHISAKDPFIAGVRVAKFDPKTLRIVIDLKQAIRADIFSLKPVANFQRRLVIDFYPKLKGDKDPLGDFITDKQVLAAPQNAPPLAQKSSSFVVVIDAGHGGEDPGAHGLRKTLEKEVVLQIAKRLKQLIDQQPTMTAVMTRSDDYFVPLAARVAKAQQHSAAVFVSIHADAYANRHARGSSVFMLSTRGATSAAARFLAQSQNQSDLIGGVSRSGDNYLDTTLLELIQRKTLQDSALLGKDVLEQLQKINPLHKSRVERAGFAVLKAPDIPSILVETAFISHPEEERKLRTARYQQQVAEAILNGIKRYQRQRHEQ